MEQLTSLPWAGAGFDSSRANARTCWTWTSSSSYSRVPQPTGTVQPVNQPKSMAACLMPARPTVSQTRPCMQVVGSCPTAQSGVPLHVLHRAIPTHTPAPSGLVPRRGTHHMARLHLRRDAVPTIVEGSRETSPPQLDVEVHIGTA
jgi:hypothetical protein